MRIIKPYLNNIIFGYFGAYKVYPFSASGGICQSDLICAVLIKQLAVKVYIHCDMVEKKVKIRTLVKFPSEAAFQYNLIPQNSKRCSESQEGMNPAITSSKSKAELTSVNGKMTGNENKIINYGTDPAAFDSAVANRHIILLH